MDMDPMGLSPTAVTAITANLVTLLRDIPKKLRTPHLIEKGRLGVCLARLGSALAYHLRPSRRDRNHPHRDFGYITT